MFSNCNINSCVSKINRSSFGSFPGLLMTNYTPQMLFTAEFVNESTMALLSNKTECATKQF